MTEVVPWPTGVTGTLALPEFAGTVTGDVMETTVGSNPVNVTGSGLAPLGGFTVSVRFCGEPDRFRVEGDKTSVIDPAVMVTVEGVPLRNGSLTINCATYVPATSAVKVGFTVLAPVREAVLWAGTLSNTQE